MLVLKRKEGEAIRLGDDVQISIRRVHGGRVRLRIAASEDVPVIFHQLLMGSLEIEEDEIERERDWSRVIPV